ncbi:hypothetical protein [Amycolatopsis sp. GM8]|uniref:hypothetical protein n=1 Tax=Amycolatopsis sp. GM8 TaxID=2896530 RepID=UPI001F330AE3|nr:hypothetical protein [Amycolatopsis sp. GM8]
MVIVECWGTDTGGQNGMDPTHCQGPPFTNGGHRLLSLGGGVKATMTNDANEVGAANPTDISGGNAITGPDTLGFTAVDGTHYNMIAEVPPSLNADATAPLPGNALSTFSDATGSRSGVAFEVRGGSDMPVLGCSNQQACTLEVIPIIRPYCNPDLYTANPAFKILVGTRCLQEPAATDGAPNPFLTADGWWLAAQWQNRFSFPLQMAPRPGECPVVDQRPTVTIQGSEAAQTAVAGTWSPFFCLDPKSAFKLTQTVTPEDAARTALTTGSANAIFTSQPVTDSPRPVVHAPVAATGWTVAYLVDDQNGQQYLNLTLSPLLLAKLITNSYTTDFGIEPAIGGNPTSLFQDPEFVALNPDFHTAETRVNVTWLSQDSDLFTAMFAYIDADPDARAFLDGKPDPFSGMVINPAYRGQLHPPQAGYQQLDTFVNPPSSVNEACNALPLKLYDLAAQYAISLDAAAQDVLGRKAPFQICKGGAAGVPASWGINNDSQRIGSRHVLAFTSVPLAEQYGLSMARLQSHSANSRPVAPSGWESTGGFSTIQAALGYTKQDKATGVTSPDFSIFPYNNAYAGMTPVYAAVPTCGLDPAEAGRLADFLDFAAGPGQTPGTLAGQLPPGYAPLPTAYTDYTKTAAEAVRHQTCAVPPPPADLAGAVRDELGLPAPGSTGDFGSFGGSGAGNTNAANVAAGGPAAANPALAPNAGGAPPVATGKPTTTAATRGAGSLLGRWGLAVLLIVGLVAGLLVPVVRVAGQPGHPVRVFFVRVGRWLKSAVRRESV